MNKVQNQFAIMFCMIFLFSCNLLANFFEENGACTLSAAVASIALTMPQAYTMYKKENPEGGLGVFLKKYPHYIKQALQGIRKFKKKNTGFCNSVYFCIGLLGVAGVADYVKPNKYPLFGSIKYPLFLLDNKYLVPIDKKEADYCIVFNECAHSSTARTCNKFVQTRWQNHGVIVQCMDCYRELIEKDKNSADKTSIKRTWVRSQATDSEEGVHDQCPLCAEDYGVGKRVREFACGRHFTCKKCLQIWQQLSQKRTFIHTVCDPSSATGLLDVIETFIEECVVNCNSRSVAGSQLVIEMKKILNSEVVQRVFEENKTDVSMKPAFVYEMREQLRRSDVIYQRTLLGAWIRDEQLEQLYSRVSIKNKFDTLCPYGCK